MSEARIDRIANENNTGGPVLSGITTFSGQNYFVPPRGTTAERPSDAPVGSLRFNTDSAHLEYYDGLQWLEFEASSEELGQGTSGDAGVGHRAIIHMGYGPANKNTINALNMSSGGTATDFGNSTVTARQQASCSSRTRALRGGGYSTSYISTIDYVTISSTGDATTFGNLSQARGGYLASLSSNTRGIFAGGYTDTPAATRLDTIDYVTIASTGTAQDFGDLTIGRSAPGNGLASPIRGVFFGGYSPTQQNIIDYITISSTGDAQDFGDCTSTVRSGSGASNATRGLYMSGQRSPVFSSNVIEFITIASTGNAQDFGDLLAVSDMGASAASPIKAIHHSGLGGTDISAVMLATTGNSIDFGDTSEASSQTSGCSNGHGGL